MPFRTIVIENRCKLEYSMNYMICRKGEEVYKVVIDEIKTLVIDSLQVSITTKLISELMIKKVKIIFTDDTHNPIGETVPYQNNYYSYRKIKEQISFLDERKDYLWKRIIEKKITNQAINLKLIDKENEYDMLINYSNNVEVGDKTNREGHSAKVYFNALFGKNFAREQDNSINKYLNYGYSILLSCFNREIKALGYLTELGIHHIGESNSFNLSCDFIESVRPLIDSLVMQDKINDLNYKSVFVGILSVKVKYNEKDIYLENAIKLMVEDYFNYLSTGDEKKIRFIEYEL